MTGLLITALILICTTADAQRKLKVACIGDSITEGYSIPTGKKYPEVLQQLLGDQYEVKNFGVSGRTLLRKGDYPFWNEKAYQESLAWEPDVVIIKLGTNDSKPQNWKFSKAYLNDYIDFIKSYNALQTKPTIYVSYPIPVFENKWGITEEIVKNAVIPKIRKVSRKSKTKLIDLYTPFMGKANLTYDGVHPNAEGCALLANEVYKALNL